MQSTQNIPSSKRPSTKPEWQLKNFGKLKDYELKNSYDLEERKPHPRRESLKAPTPTRKSIRMSLSGAKGITMNDQKAAAQADNLEGEDSVDKSDALLHSDAISGNVSMTDIFNNFSVGSSTNIPSVSVEDTQGASISSDNCDPILSKAELNLSHTGTSADSETSRSQATASGEALDGYHGASASTECSSTTTSTSRSNRLNKNRSRSPPKKQASGTSKKPPSPLKSFGTGRSDPLVGPVGSVRNRDKPVDIDRSQTSESLPRYMQPLNYRVSSRERPIKMNDGEVSDKKSQADILNPVEDRSLSAYSGVNEANRINNSMGDDENNISREKNEQNFPSEKASEQLNSSSDDPKGLQAKFASDPAELRRLAQWVDNLPLCQKVQNKAGYLSSSRLFTQLRAGGVSKLAVLELFSLSDLRNLGIPPDGARAIHNAMKAQTAETNKRMKAAVSRSPSPHKSVVQTRNDVTQRLRGPSYAFKKSAVLLPPPAAAVATSWSLDLRKSNGIFSPLSGNYSPTKAVSIFPERSLLRSSSASPHKVDSPRRMGSTSNSPEASSSPLASKDIFGNLLSGSSITSHPTVAPIPAYNTSELSPAAELLTESTDAGLIPKAVVTGAPVQHNDWSARDETGYTLYFACIKAFDTGDGDLFHFPWDTAKRSSHDQRGTSLEFLLHLYFATVPLLRLFDLDDHTKSYSESKNVDECGSEVNGDKAIDSSANRASENDGRESKRVNAASTGDIYVQESAIRSLTEMIRRMMSKLKAFIKYDIANGSCATNKFQNFCQLPEKATPDGSSVDYVDLMKLKANSDFSSFLEKENHNKWSLQVREKLVTCLSEWGITSQGSYWRDGHRALSSVEPDVPTGDLLHGSAAGVKGSESLRGRSTQPRPVNSSPKRRQSKISTKHAASVRAALSPDSAGTSEAIAQAAKSGASGILVVNTTGSIRAASPSKMTSASGSIRFRTDSHKQARSLSPENKFLAHHLFSGMKTSGNHVFGQRTTSSGSTIGAPLRAPRGQSLSSYYADLRKELNDKAAGVVDRKEIEEARKFVLEEEKRQEIVRRAEKFVEADNTDLLEEMKPQPPILEKHRHMSDERAIEILGGISPARPAVGSAASKTNVKTIPISEVMPHTLDSAQERKVTPHEILNLGLIEPSEDVDVEVAPLHRQAKEKATSSQLSQNSEQPPHQISPQDLCIDHVDDVARAADMSENSGVTDSIVEVEAHNDSASDCDEDVTSLNIGRLEDHHASKLSTDSLEAPRTPPDVKRSEISAAMSPVQTTEAAAALLATEAQKAQDAQNGELTPLRKGLADLKDADDQILPMKSKKGTKKERKRNQQSRE